MIIDTPKIFENDSWEVFVAPSQVYLGRVVIVCKNIRPDLSSLDANEWKDFQDTIGKLESAAKSAFGATMFNWACLMNDAYKDPDPKPQVHWHMRPRYAQTPNLGGVDYPDPNFGHHYSSPHEKENPLATSQQLETIAAAYRAYP